MFEKAAVKLVAVLAFIGLGTVVGTASYVSYRLGKGHSEQCCHKCDTAKVSVDEPTATKHDFLHI